MNSEGLTEIEKEMQKEIEYTDCLRNIKFYNYTDTIKQKIKIIIQK